MVFTFTTCAHWHGALLWVKDGLSKSVSFPQLHQRNGPEVPRTARCAQHPNGSEGVSHVGHPFRRLGVRERETCPFNPPVDSNARPDHHSPTPAGAAALHPPCYDGTRLSAHTHRRGREASSTRPSNPTPLG